MKRRNRQVYVAQEKRIAELTFLLETMTGACEKAIEELEYRQEVIDNQKLTIKVYLGENDKLLQALARMQNAISELTYENGELFAELENIGIGAVEDIEVYDFDNDRGRFN